jgi:ABC-2 family transporter protein
MTNSLLDLAGVGGLLCLVQLVAALPWLSVLDPVPLRTRLRQLPLLGWALLGVVMAGGALALFLQTFSNPADLTFSGRFYGALLHLQLAADFFVLAFAVLLRIWPKGAAVALAAFREGIRQPMFWLLTCAAGGLMVISTLVPYFTLAAGEELKMVKELGYDTAMLAAVVFGVISASMSISEEIEGRTAITLMSKPVSRRQFLLGKFVGILLAALVMTAILGWVFIWVVQLKLWYDPDPVQRPVDPAWVVDAVQRYAPPGEPAAFLKGLLLWTDDLLTTLPGLVIGFCQVMVLLAIAVALATRLPMVVNLPVCLVFYFLGHLTPILKAVSQNRSNLANTLINFMAQLFDALLPGLELFDMGPAVVRETPLPAAGFALYTANVSLYAVLYTGIALLFGLILFEDRDLA